MPLALTCTTSVLPLLPTMPEVVARCNQPLLAASTVALHDTGCEQFPVTLSVSVCAGGFDCSRVAIKLSCAGATCSMHGRGAGVVVGVPSTTVGVGVPGIAVLDATGEGVATGVPGTDVVGSGVPPGKVPETVDVLPGVADGESTVNCTISVCERISVSRSTCPLYVPGASALVLKSRLAFVTAPGCN